MNKKKLILICGTGSIAKRHAKNLLTLGYKNLIFFRETKRTLPSWMNKFEVFYNYNKALKCKPFITFICNITSKHLIYAIKSAKKKSHLFIEKPISNKIEGLNRLKKIIKKNNLKLMVGYMMRYHPLIIKIKNIIKKRELGNIFYIHSIWSEYLPDWHPGENYKKSYAANYKLGGGSTLTLSHEVDLISWLFGEIKEITTLKSYKSKLNIKSEFSTNHQLKLNKDIVAQIHLDYMQKPPERKMEVVGDKKKLLFDYYKNKIIIINRNGKKREIRVRKFKRNQMFVDEIKFFLRSISQNLKIYSDIDNSIMIIKRILK